MDEQRRKKVISYFADKMETETFKDYLTEIGEHIPDYWFDMPASTTKKYHSVQQCKPCGQVLHCMLFSCILEHLLRLRYFQDKFPKAEIRDCLRVAPIMHDAFKKGLNNSMHTVQDHPKIAADFVLSYRGINDIPREYKVFIAGLCEAHSGEWNKDRAGNQIMKYPENDGEFLIHFCDILSSRNDIIWDIPQEMQEIFDGVTEKQRESSKQEMKLETFRMPFGKYIGMTIPEIKQENPGYIQWALENLQEKDFYHLFTQI